MNVEVKQLKDTLTGEVFVPLTHWDAVVNKPEDIAKESTVVSQSQDIISTVNTLAQALSKQMLANTGELSTAKQEIIDTIQTLQEYITSIEEQLQNREFARMKIVGVNGRQSVDIVTVKANSNSTYLVENNTLICESDEIDNTKTLVMMGGKIENNILYL